MSICFRRAVSLIQSSKSLQIQVFSHLPTHESQVTTTLRSQTSRLLKPASFRFIASMPGTVAINGDLNNTSVLRQVEHIAADPAFSFRSLAITEEKDDADVRKKYRPFLLEPEVTANDWISKLELSTAIKLAEADLEATGERLKVLVLYGSLRSR